VRAAFSIHDAHTAYQWRRSKMARYFYAWIPAVALSAVLLFVVPFLGLITAVVFAAGAVAALGALVWRMVAALDAFVRFVVRRRPHDVRGTRARAAGLPARPQTATALEYHRS
jgi:hypothetical protein